MTGVTSAQIVDAAVDAAIAELKKHGLSGDTGKLPRLFHEALLAKTGLTRVVLKTPSGNAGALRGQIAAQLEKKLGHPVEIEEKADPSIIGGAILTIGDERIDMSVKNALQNLEHQLRAASSPA